MVWAPNETAFDYLLGGHLWASFATAGMSVSLGLWFGLLIIITVLGVYLKSKRESWALITNFLLVGLLFQYLNTSFIVFDGVFSSVLLAKVFFDAFIKRSDTP